MEVKKLVCILVALYSATVACNRNNPVPEKKGRSAETRLSETETYDSVKLLLALKDDAIQQTPASEVALYNRALA